MHPSPANCNKPTRQRARGFETNDARLTRILADTVSRAADHTADRIARGHLLDATARLFDAMARLEMIEGRAPQAVAHV